MALLIEDNLMTGIITTPLREGWIESDVPFELVPGLGAAQIGRGDVALLNIAEAASLTETHFIDSSIGIASGSAPDAAISPKAMRTPVRPDGIEQTPIRMIDTTPTCELLIRALLRPFFGITADGFVHDASDPAAADAQVVIIDGLLGLTEPEHGYQEDLVKAWYVLTGTAAVFAVTVVGVDADGGDRELALLREAIAVGVERRRDVRRILAGENDAIDRGKLAAITNSLRYELDESDLRSAGNLLVRGTWGTAWRRQLPAVK